MRNKIIVSILLVGLMIFTLSACTTKTTGGTPIDGTWDYIVVYSGTEIIYENNNVKVKVTESRINNWSSNSDTWIHYEISENRGNGKTVNIVDSPMITLVYWNN